MPDIIRAEGRAGVDQPQIRYKDMGDGTHAQVVVVEGGVGGSGGLTDAQLRASRVNVEPLGIPGTARQQATTTTSANVQLTVGVGRISLFARLQPLRYVVGSGEQTANAASSHYLASGERIDIDVPATPNIAVIRASDATGDGAAEITELS